MVKIGHIVLSFLSQFSFLNLNKPLRAKHSKCIKLSTYIRIWSNGRLLSTVHDLFQMFNVENDGAVNLLLCIRKKITTWNSNHTSPIWFLYFFHIYHLYTHTFYIVSVERIKDSGRESLDKTNLLLAYFFSLDHDFSIYSH